MSPRDRLLSPLRRFPSQDAVTQALTAVFGAETLDRAAFSEGLLRSVPLERLQATVDGLRERHGALRGVRRRQELYQLQFATGSELVWAQVTDDGRLTTLVTGPGALTARQSGGLPPQSRTDLPVLAADAVATAGADADAGAGAGVDAGVGVAPQPGSARAPEPEHTQGSAGAEVAATVPGSAQGAGSGLVGSAPVAGSTPAAGRAAGSGSVTVPGAPPMPSVPPTLGTAARRGSAQVTGSAQVPGSAQMPGSAHAQGTETVPGSTRAAGAAVVQGRTPAVGADAVSSTAPVQGRTPAVGADAVSSTAPVQGHTPAVGADAVSGTTGPGPGAATAAGTAQVAGTGGVRGAAPAVGAAPGPGAPAAAGAAPVHGAGGVRGVSSVPGPAPARGATALRVASPSATALTRLTLSYLAAAVATAVIPYLTATATGWLLLVATAPALAWYALRTGPTHALPPWFRALPLAAVALAVLAGLRALPAFGPGLPWTMPGIPELLLFAAGTGLAGWTWRRTRPIQPSPSAHPLVLASPLRGGCFSFTEAGGPAVNRYAQDSLTPGASRHRRYAMDLVQLGDGPQWRGRRALGLAPAGNQRYAIFGHPVLSPCDGVVVAAVDGLPDHDPYAPAVDHPEGNHVAIDTGRALVVLSWLRQDSVRVRRGQHLTVGTPVGAVGDSGDGSEPALHLRAETRTSQPTPGSGLGLPFRLSGLRGTPLRGRRLRLPD
ncbi:peptidoglycan DD-metalloendopeptidase family protein [Streptacidiphilus sp. N1-12]|uniref:Peptidoglycan DD-metalloendopeptidase family protein n=2 Tax=Streptacidiphilus alkalitolerans TaxID=3342712 RepID=A0ABV6WGR5_9ACTN